MYCFSVDPRLMIRLNGGYLINQSDIVNYLRTSFLWNRLIFHNLYQKKAISWLSLWHDALDHLRWYLTYIPLSSAAGSVSVTMTIHPINIANNLLLVNNDLQKKKKTRLKCLYLIYYLLLSNVTIEIIPFKMSIIRNE